LPALTVGTCCLLYQSENRHACLPLGLLSFLLSYHDFKFELMPYHDFKSACLAMPALPVNLLSALPIGQFEEIARKIARKNHKENSNQKSRKIAKKI